MEQETPAFEILTGGGIVTKDWRAYINAFPPRPKSLFVFGQVEVSNLASRAFLIPRASQGDPLIFDLIVVNFPIPSGTMNAFVPVTFSGPVGGATYKTVKVFFEGGLVVEIPVETAT